MTWFRGIESLRMLYGDKRAPESAQTKAAPASAAQEESQMSVQMIPQPQTNGSHLSELYPGRSDRVLRGTHDAPTFRKQLAWIIKESPVAVRMEITPEMASVMMERNASDEWHNRPQSSAGIARFTKALRAGRWMYTGEALIFSSTGRLLNGQHRLMACMDSGVSLEALCAFGVDDSAFAFMDVGVTRTAAHIFAIEDIQNYNFAAAVARIAYAYCASVTWSGNHHNVVGNDELLAFYREHPDIGASFTIARALRREVSMTPSWGGFVHWVCAQKNRSQADEFFDRVASGLDIHGRGDPVFVIRKRLIDAAKAPAGRGESDVYLAAFAIQCWNSMRQGKSRSIARWRSQNANEPFPRAI